MKTFNFDQCMRWYGPRDEVTLEDIAQAGCTGVVTALYHIPIGEIWNTEEIIERKKQVEEKGLKWKVVESLPVHEDIKKGESRSGEWIDNYKNSIANLAECGIEVITYNFMPVLDWLRTNVRYALPNGAETLLFYMDEYRIFDLFILKRPGALSEVDDHEVSRLQNLYSNMSESDLERLKRTMLLGLPGSDEQFRAEDVLTQIADYAQIDDSRLRSNLYSFLSEISPVAESQNVQLAIHPDDPPFSVFGLPRIMSTETDIESLMLAVPNKSNGLCFCSGSYGSRKDNDLPEMIKKWGSKIYFFHLRNTKRSNDGSFREDNHLEGDTNMYDVIFEACNLMQREQRNIPMRPDHGFRILDDHKKNTYPGYSAIGRLKGLAEIRGVEYAITNYHQPPISTETKNPITQ